jgi:hypothetical protein
MRGLLIFIFLFIIFHHSGFAQTNENDSLDHLRKFSFEVNLGITEIGLKSIFQYQIDQKNAIGIKMGRIFFVDGIGVTYSYYFSKSGRGKFLLGNVIRFEISYLYNKIALYPLWIPNQPTINHYFNILYGHEHLIAHKFGINFFFGIGGSFYDFVFPIPSISLSLKYNM